MSWKCFFGHKWKTVYHCKGTAKKGFWDRHKVNVILYIKVCTKCKEVQCYYTDGYDKANFDLNYFLDSTCQETRKEASEALREEGIRVL